MPFLAPHLVDEKGRAVARVPDDRDYPYHPPKHLNPVEEPRNEKAPSIAGGALVKIVVN